MSLFLFLKPNIFLFLLSLAFLSYDSNQTLLRERLGTRLRLRSQKILIFFLLKFNMVCMFWIVLMC